MRDTKFEGSALHSLSRLVGAKYLFLSGRNLEGVLASDNIIVTTSAGSLVFRGDSEEFDVNGEWEDFAYTELSQASETQLQEALASGNIYKQLADQYIKDVVVITDVIECESKLGNCWRHSTDSGVAFLTDKGFVLLSRNTLHSELMFVHFGIEFDVSLVPDFTSHFENTLDTCFSTSRTLSSVGGKFGTLLNQAGDAQ